MEWYQILSYIIGGAGVLLGAAFYTRWNKVVKLLLELGQAFTKTSEVLSDKKVTKKEALEMLKEWQDVYGALLTILPAGLVKKILGK